MLFKILMEFLRRKKKNLIDKIKNIVENPYVCWHNLRNYDRSHKIAMTNLPFKSYGASPFSLPNIDIEKLP